MQLDMARLIGGVVGNLIGAAVGSLIGAIFLRAAAWWVARLAVPYWRGYTTALLGFLISFPIGFVAGLIMGINGATQTQLMVLQLVLVPVSFLIQTAVVSRRLELSFGRAALVVLVMFALGLAVALLIGIVVGIAIVVLGR